MDYLFNYFVSFVKCSNRLHVILRVMLKISEVGRLQCFYAAKNRTKKKDLVLSIIIF